MDTLFLLYVDQGKQARQTQDERAKAMAAHWATMDEAAAQGKLKNVSPLQPASTAITVRANGAGFTVTDGPFAETKEMLGGYYIIDCQDTNEAKHWAERLAGIGAIGSVEARPLAPLPARS